MPLKNTLEETATQIFLESDKVFKTLLGEKKQYLFKIAKQVMHNAFFSLWKNDLICLEALKAKLLKI